MAHPLLPLGQAQRRLVRSPLGLLHEALLQRTGLL